MYYSQEIEEELEKVVKEIIKLDKIDEIGISRSTVNRWTRELFNKLIHSY